MKFHIDVLQWNGCGGWIFAPGKRFLIEVWRGGECVAGVPQSYDRSDVAVAYSGTKEALRSGFWAPLKLVDDGEPFLLKVTACEIDAEGRRTGAPVDLAVKPVMGPKAIQAAFAPRTDPLFSAFPKGVEAAVCALWPEVKPAGADAAAQRVVAGKLKEMMTRTARVAAPETLISYLWFLSAIQAHFRFVVRYFPSMNETQGEDAKDHCATPNSERELLSIANHLYVMKSYGVTGDFAEFGCFKGFSSSMLSFACSLLGIKMHIFDSFAGLPPSDSKYYKAGDFAGSLEEVRRNVTQFGVIDSVEFHKGFFDDSVPRDRNGIAKLTTLWMDVDLYLSAKGVMGMFDKLDRRGAIFSHECNKSSFDGEKVLPARAAPEEPLPAILEAYAEHGVEPAGRFIHGTTGSFWSRKEGVPVLDSAALMDIIAAI